MTKRGHSLKTQVIRVPRGYCPRCDGPMTTPALAWKKRKPKRAEVGICSRCADAALYVMAIRLHGQVLGAPGQNVREDSDDRVGDSRIPAEEDRLDVQTAGHRAIWRA